MKRILGVLLAGVLLLSGCGQWQKSQKEKQPQKPDLHKNETEAGLQQEGSEEGF